VSALKISFPSRLYEIFKNDIIYLTQAEVFHWLIVLKCFSSAVLCLSIQIRVLHF